jgi:hypothetical protein
VNRALTPAALLVALACGGPQQPAPEDMATTPEGAVRNFMQAVADSNIARMGRYWGTTKGPASIVRQPADYEQRLGVTQAFLRNSPYRIVRTDPVIGDDARKMVVVELSRADPDGNRCTKALPFGVINAGKHGWIVNAVNLTLAGTPGRACSPAPAKPAS